MFSLKKTRLPWLCARIGVSLLSIRKDISSDLHSLILSSRGRSKMENVNIHAKKESHLRVTKEDSQGNIVQRDKYEKVDVKISPTPDKEGRPAIQAPKKSS
uniref:Uncharacterized protein LOC111112718 n=1 Tax=Crassostrea virginica TaxID=6565 RepID=A0A8B8BS53_CRAVI|nr:uncharacterized protein LOC111112718 [Crassostrea virginica]